MMLFDSWTCPKCTKTQDLKLTRKSDHRCFNCDPEVEKPPEARQTGNAFYAQRLRGLASFLEAPCQLQVYGRLDVGIGFPGSVGGVGIEVPHNALVGAELVQGCRISMHDRLDPVQPVPSSDSPGTPAS